MRKFFFGLGIAAAALILLIVAFIGYGVYVGAGVSKEGGAYADNAVVTITAHWDVKELTKRATPALLKQVKPEALASLFDWFATLGPLVDYQGSKQVSWSQFTGTGGTVVSAEYHCSARYKAGPATIDLGLQKSGGVWRINSFRVNSDILIENKAGRRT